MDKPWGPMDPNSQHQLWSRWKFTVHGTRIVPMEELKLNVAKWLRKGFGSVGQARISQKLSGVVIECEIEGPPAHDPDYVTSVRRGFRRFVTEGWGTFAFGNVTVEIMAGDVQDGKPPDQLIVMPTILRG